MSRDKRTIRERAEDYVKLIAAPGAQILDETDGEYVRPFKHLIPGLLFKRGLYLKACEGGMVVTTSPPWLTRRLQDLRVQSRANRIACRKCTTPWFDCEHGAQLIVAGPVDPVMPWVGSIQPVACA